MMRLGWALSFFALLGLLLVAPLAVAQVKTKDAAKDAKEEDGKKKKVKPRDWREVADPLHVAAFEGNLGEMKRLLGAKDVDVDVRLDFRAFPQFTPLHLAAYEGHAKIIDLLVSRKAALNLVEKKNKRTALHLAAAYGRVDAVKALIKAGAALDLKDKAGNTALELATEPAIVAALTKAGAAKP